jgi:DNA-binding IclR family transcriptional regulator
MPKGATVPALERALAILEKLGQSRQGLTLSQLSRYLVLPKSSAHCLLRTLERRGYVRRERLTGRYRLGLQVWSLASAALRSVEIRDLAAPLLRRLHEQTGLTVHLAILSGGQAIVIDKYAPAGTSHVGTWLGRRMDLHCTAVGKALAAYLPEEELEQQVRLRGLLRYNDNTIGSFRRLKAELAQTRRRGYAVDDEEEAIGVRCLGAPVLNGQGDAVAAVSISGTIAEINSANWQRLVAAVMDTARAIASRLALEERGSHEELPAHAGIRAPLLPVCEVGFQNLPGGICPFRDGAPQTPSAAESN